MASHKKTTSPSLKGLHKKQNLTTKNRRTSVYLKRLDLPDDMKIQSPPLSLRRTRRQSLALVKPFLNPTSTTHVSKPVEIARKSPKKSSRSRLPTAKHVASGRGTKATRLLRSQLPSIKSSPDLTKKTKLSLEKNKSAPNIKTHIKAPKSPEAFKSPPSKKKLPSHKSKSPVYSPKSSSAGKIKSPADKTKAPGSKIKSPADKTKAPASKTKSPAGKTKSPAGKTKLPTGKIKSPAAKKESQVRKTKLPAGKSKSPASKSKSASSISRSKEDIGFSPKMSRSSRRKSLRLVHTPAVDYKDSVNKVPPVQSDIAVSPRKRKASSPVTKKTSKSKTASSSALPQKTHGSPVETKTRGRKSKTNTRNITSSADIKCSPSPNKKLEDKKLSPQKRKLEDKKDEKMSPSPKKKLATQKIKLITSDSKLSVSPRESLKSSKSSVKYTATPSPTKGSSSYSSRNRAKLRTPSPSKKSISVSVKSRKVKMNATSPAHSAVSYRKTPASKKKVKYLEEEEDLGSSPALPSARAQLQRIREFTPIRSSKSVKNSAASPTTIVISSFKVTPTPRQALKKMNGYAEKQMDTVITKADVHKPCNETTPSTLWTPNTPAPLSTFHPTPKSLDHTSVLINRATESHQTLLRSQGSRRSPSPSSSSNSTPVEDEVDSREEKTLEIEVDDESFEDDSDTAEDEMENGDEKEDNKDANTSEEELTVKNKRSYCVVM